MEKVCWGCGRAYPEEMEFCTKEGCGKELRRWGEFNPEELIHLREKADTDQIPET